MGRALALAASDAGLFTFAVNELRVVRLVDGMLLEYGRGASPDAIATIACREVVRDRGDHSEDSVRREVQKHGFVYVAIEQSDVSSIVREAFRAARAR